MPVPQRVNFLVEQASCLLLENGARCEFYPRYGKAIQDMNQPVMAAPKGEIKILNFFLILLIINN